MKTTTKVVATVAMATALQAAAGCSGPDEPAPTVSTRDPAPSPNEPLESVRDRQLLRYYFGGGTQLEEIRLNPFDTGAFVGSEATEFNGIPSTLTGILNRECDAIAWSRQGQDRELSEYDGSYQCQLADVDDGEPQVCSQVNCVLERQSCMVNLLLELASQAQPREMNVWRVDSNADVLFPVQSRLTKAALREAALGVAYASLWGTATGELVVEEFGSSSSADLQGSAADCQAQYPRAEGDEETTVPVRSCPDLTAA